MEFSDVISNLTSPALLFFVLGICAVRLKSDLKIPENSSKFISLYLLFSIGFKGGQELSHSLFGTELVLSIVFGILLSALIPLAAFLLLRRKFNTANSAAIAAAYGSVSAVTFVTTIAVLESKNIDFDGYMVAVMASMEAPAIIVGVLLMRIFDKKNKVTQKFSSILKHSFTNASVFLIIGSLLIGFVANEQQAEGIKPFTTDLFKGFLAIFLLDMGITSGKHLSTLCKKGIAPFAFASLMPFVFGTITFFIASYLTPQIGNQVLFALLGASASYIAVPAAMKTSIPSANPGLYLPMALGMTFPINVMIGIPYYLYLATVFN